MKQNTLYLDMDGVLADFNSAARQYLSPHHNAEMIQDTRWPKETWAHLIHVPHLYRHLPKTVWADQLVELALQFQDQLGYRVAILTAIPRNNDVKDAFQDKFDWVQEHYPHLRIYFGPYSHDKQHHAQPGDILVDDRLSNCEEWQQMGGRAIRLTDRQWQQALDQLTQILNQELARL